MCRSICASQGIQGKNGRIPQNLREANIKAYEPYFLSIGPYHHDNPKVQRMEKRKRFVLKCCLKQNSKLILKDLLMEIKDMESEVRRFYSDVEIDSEKFIQMLLLDGLYVLSVFCGMPKGQENVNPVNDCMDTGDENEITTENNVDRQRWFWIMFPHDIFLVENQIPFFLLQNIYALLYGGTKTQLIGILKNKVSILLSDYIYLEPEMVMLSTEKFYHLLHLCHIFLRTTIKIESTAFQVHESGEIFRLGNVAQLYEAGVNFEAKFDSTQHSLLDITFDSWGKMVMPYLHVDDNVDALLSNLIVLEQMKYPGLGLNISAYAVLFLHLVTTSEDVQLLRRKGIIQHHLASDKEMMHLINRLSVGLSFDYVEDNYSLKLVFLEMKRYTERRVPRWRAWLKHRYFNNPW